MITYNNGITTPAQGSLVRDLLDANTPSNSRTALDSLATTLNEPVKPFSPASANKMRVIEQPVYDTGSEEQVGMFGQPVTTTPEVQETSSAFSEGWETGFITDVPRHESSSRYNEWGAPVQEAIQLEKSVEGLAEGHKIGGGLSFGNTREVDNTDPQGKQKVEELNNFIKSDAYLKGFETFKADIASQGLDAESLSIQDMQKIYADANGVGAHNNAVKWDNNSGQFKFVEDKFDVGDVAVIGAKAFFTFAGGIALAPMFAAAGLGTTAAASAGKAMASAISTAVQGGDLKDVVGSAVFAGAAQYATSASEAANAAKAANVAQGANATAEAISSAASLADKATLASNVSNALKVVKAVDEKDLIGGVLAATDMAGVATETSKNTLKAINAVENKNILGGVEAALALGGLDSPVTYAQEMIEDNFGDIEWVSQNSTALAEAAIQFTDKVTQGSSIEDSLLSAAHKYAEEEGGLSQLLPDGFDTGSFELDDEFIRTIIATGKEIDKEYIQPAKNTVVEIVKETGKFVEEHLPDVPPVDLSGFGETLSKFNKDEIQPVIADIKDFIDDIDLPDIDLPDINLPDFSSLLAGGSSGSGSRGTGSSKADLVNIMLTDPELVKGIEYADLSNYLTKERTI